MDRKTQQQIRREIRTLENRVTGSMAVTRLIIRVQIERYAEAERIRLAALALVKSQWQHRCKNDRVAGCTAVSDEKLSALEDALRNVHSFKMPPVPARIAKLVGIKQKGKRR